MQPAVSNIVCTSYLGINKKGVIKPDAQGAYEVCIGGFNCFNNTQEWFELDRSKHLFQHDSMMQIQARNRSLRGEYGHPKPEVGQDAQSFYNRALRIEEKNVSHTLVEIWLVEEGRDRQGRPVVMVMAKIVPSGPYGECLRRDFEQGLINVCFSVRSLTDIRIWERERRRVMTKIMTYDYVNLPGVEFATKYDTPTMLSADQQIIMPRDPKIILPEHSQPVSAGGIIIPQATMQYDMPITGNDIQQMVLAQGGKSGIAMLSGDSPLVYLEQLRQEMRCDVVKQGSFNHW